MQYTKEPLSMWFIDDFNIFLIWASEIGASDITLLPGSPIWLRINGDWNTVTKRSITTNEIGDLVDDMSRNPSSSAIVKGGKDIDFAHEIKQSRIKSMRFRVNASGCRDNWSFGISVVMRSIPSIAPNLDDPFMAVEKEIIKNSFPSNGLILITGTMGSGKSTLLASMMGFIKANFKKHIITYEMPIEFDLMGAPGNKAIVVQTEIPTHLDAITSAARNSARRAADVILMGEIRDQETVKGIFEASEIGVAAYSTMHTKSVSETIPRAIGLFSENERANMLSMMITSLRVIVHQRLVPRLGGGRIALREFLVFDREIRDSLQNETYKNMIGVVQALVENRGQSLLSDAQNKFNQNLIHQDELNKVIKEYELREQQIKKIGENHVA